MTPTVSLNDLVVVFMNGVMSTFHSEGVSLAVKRLGIRRVAFYRAFDMRLQRATSRNAMQISSCEKRFLSGLLAESSCPKRLPKPETEAEDLEILDSSGG